MSKFNYCLAITLNGYYKKVNELLKSLRYKLYETHKSCLINEETYRILNSFNEMSIKQLVEEYTNHHKYAYDTVMEAINSDDTSLINQAIGVVKFSFNIGIISDSERFCLLQKLYDDLFRVATKNE